jgi:guanylate kinase
MESPYKKGKLIVIGGPSGAGKTTSAQMLSKNYDFLNHYREQYTTRNPRPQEVKNSAYRFISEEKLNELKKRGQIDVCTRFLDNFYAFGNGFRKEVKTLISRGQSVVVDSIHDYSDWKNFEDQNPEIPNVKLFLHADDFEELRRRIASRQEISSERVQRRLEHARKHLNQVDNFDYIIETNDFSRHQEKLENFVKEHVGRVELQK